MPLTFVTGIGSRRRGSCLTVRFDVSASGRLPSATAGGVAIGGDCAPSAVSLVAKGVGPEELGVLLAAEIIYLAREKMYGAELGQAIKVGAYRVGYLEDPATCLDIWSRDCNSITDKMICADLASRTSCRLSEQEAVLIKGVSPCAHQCTVHENAAGS